MPSARMAQDAEISATLGLMQNTQRYNFDFQVTPWLEGTFRYGHIYGANHFSDYHRNIGFKIRLFEETDYTPAIALGARDVIGTGRQSAEFLVASKLIGDFDITAGVGWGRLADDATFRNPFAVLFPSFENRSVGPVTGGTPAFGQLFHGHSMGAFGGIVWKSPVPGLDVLAEYSSDKYTSERDFGVMKTRAPVNVGVSYALFSNLRIMAGWFYGTSYGATLTYATNPSIVSTEPRIGPPVPPAQIRTDLQQMSALRQLNPRDEPGLNSAQFWSGPAGRARAEQTLREALLSQSRGMKDLEITGRTLLVDAAYFEDANSQCEAYARIAAVNQVPVDSIALTDPGDASGAVSLCDVSEPVGEVVIDAGGTQHETDTDKKIRADVAAQSLRVDALSVARSELWIYYRNERYRNETEAAGRIIRVLLNDAPPDVEIFHAILVQHGIAVREFQVTRSAMERVVAAGGDASELGEAVTVRLPDLHQPVLDAQLGEVEPQFTWSLAPGLKQSFFDPRAPIQVQILARAVGDIELTKGLDILGEYDVNIYNNFDLKTPSVSQLPHVRSDAAKYFRFGANGIAVLEGIHRFRLAPDIYTEFRAGYLEDMFAGFGGQILWRPDGQRIALGIDLYQVWQRDFDRLFGLQHYNILTGHVTLYYESPWYDLNFAVHAGRYLAGDYGGTIEITRRFETGVEIGAFATFTNVPFSKFGEGSFDKGFIVRVPLEWSLPFYTQSQHYTVLHSLARDGGQRLYNDDPLYEETRSASYGEISSHIGALTDP